MNRSLAPPGDRPYKRRRLDEAAYDIHRTSSPDTPVKSFSVASLLCAPQPASNASTPFSYQSEETDIEGQYWCPEASPLSRTNASSNDVSQAATPELEILSENNVNTGTNGTPEARIVTDVQCGHVKFLNTEPPRCVSSPIPTEALLEVTSEEILSLKEVTCRECRMSTNVRQQGERFSLFWDAPQRTGLSGFKTADGPACSSLTDISKRSQSIHRRTSTLVCWGHRPANGEHSAEIGRARRHRVAISNKPPTTKTSTACW